MEQPIDLDRARRDVYEEAYDTFDSLDVNHFNQFETYAALQEVYDEELSQYVRRTYFEDPSADFIDVIRKGNRGKIKSTAFYDLMDEAMERAIADVFDHNKSKHDSLEIGAKQ